MNTVKTSNNNYKSCQSHCCNLHGCKYNLQGCPVVNGTVNQDYPCEQCDDGLDLIDDPEDTTETHFTYQHGFKTAHFDTLQETLAHRERDLRETGVSKENTTITQHWQETLDI